MTTAVNSGFVSTDGCHCFTISFQLQEIRSTCWNFSLILFLFLRFWSYLALSLIAFVALHLSLSHLQFSPLNEFLLCFLIDIKRAFFCALCQCSFIGHKCCQLTFYQCGLYAPSCSALSRNIINPFLYSFRLHILTISLFFSFMLSFSFYNSIDQKLKFSLFNVIV